VGTVLGYLEENDLFENTLVVVTRAWGFLPHSIRA